MHMNQTELMQRIKDNGVKVLCLELNHLIDGSNKIVTFRETKNSCEFLRHMFADKFKFVCIHIAYQKRSFSRIYKKNVA